MYVLFLYGVESEEIYLKKRSTPKTFDLDENIYIKGFELEIEYSQSTRPLI